METQFQSLQPTGADTETWTQEKKERFDELRGLNIARDGLSGAEKDELDQLAREFW